jgi:hypothetical protein
VTLTTGIRISHSTLTKKHQDMKNRENEKKQKPTPIVDGDARPDMPLTPGNEKKSGIEKKTKTTVNRADKDSREDFKDAKMD